MYHIKKTNRYFENPRSVTNHIRKIYNSTEEAYISENEIVEIPKCKFCDKNSKFIGFFHGYYFRCNSSECVEKSKQETYKNVIIKRIENKKTRSTSENSREFRQFLYDNLTFYRENFEKTNIIDPYFNVRTNKLTLYSFLRRKFNNQVLNETRICKFCDKQFKLNIIKDDLSKQHCNSKDCTQLEINGYCSNSIIFDNSRDLNNFSIENRFHWRNVRSYAKNYKIWNGIFRIENYNIVRLFNCPITGWIIPLTNKSDTLRRFLKRNDININEYFEKFIPEAFLVCKQCGSKKLFRISGNSEITRELCSKKCFDNFKKANPDQFVRTEESIFQQSQTMKNLIADGKFTPNITNSWTHWDAVIELEDGTKKKFRSSWEACFWLCNQNLQYEKLRIKYEVGDTWRTYIADFFDPEHQILYEIKPKSEWTGQSDKMQKIIQHCLENDIKFIWLNENNILDYIDIEKFTGSNIAQLNKLLNGTKKN